MKPICKPVHLLPYLGGLKILCIVVAGFFAQPVQSQTCWMDGASTLSFSGVSPDRLADSTTTLNLTCANGGPPAFLNYCINISIGDGGGGFNPRSMRDWLRGPSPLLAYSLYSDAARTQLVGPAGSGSTLTGIVVLPSGNSLLSIPIYGRVPAGQNPPAGGYWENQPGGQIASNASVSGPPASCVGGYTSTFYQLVEADVPGGCRITLATDLDFGSVAALAANRDQTSTILVRCPMGTPWAMGLDNGANPLLPATRRMRSTAGQFVSYELYKNVMRSQRWGAMGSTRITGTGAGEATPSSSTVYGRIPAQPLALPGTYSDTITVTLTY